MSTIEDETIDELKELILAEITPYSCYTDKVVVTALMDVIEEKGLFATVAGECTKSQLSQLIEAIDNAHPELMVVS